MIFGQNIVNKSARVLSFDSVIARALLTCLQEQTCYFGEDSSFGFVFI